MVSQSQKKNNSNTYFLKGAFKLKDRLIAGGLAGLIAGVIQNAYGAIVKAVGITDRSFSDFAEVLVMNKTAQTITGGIVGFIGHIIVGIMFGVLFSYIIFLTSHKYNLLKGVGYGAILWFLLMGFGTIFNLTQFKDIPPVPALTTFIGALIYGVALAYSLKMIDQKTRLL